MTTLSRAYASRDDAAIGGFKRILMNSNAWKTQEFAFWVVLAHNSRREVEYFYTAPVTDDSGSGVKAAAPQGQIVRAYCHTHPGSVASGDFSYDDKLSFVASQAKLPSIVWYLLNPQMGIRLAEAECDFPSGKEVRLRDSVQP
jgi:hypothetical protein